MKRFLGLAAALLVLSAGAGFVVYLRRHPRPLDIQAARSSPTAMASRYRIILKREILSFTSLWHNGPIQGSGYVGSGSSSDSDVSLESSLALADSTIAYTGSPSPEGHQDAIDAGRLIRYLVYTHRMGNGSATDGQKWGGTDAAAVSAANLGLAAYMDREWLDARTVSSVADVIRFEAERYLLMSPAAGAAGDSAAMSNAAASSILCVAASFYSRGGARAAYQRRATAYLSHVLVTFFDVAQGRSASPTLFTDMTLQSGGVFSASAELQVLGALAHCALCYQMSGTPPPPELDQHVVDVWRRALVKLSVSDGWFVGSDGSVVTGGAAVTWLATAFNDSAARAIDRSAADRTLKSPELRGDVTITPLTEPRTADTAYQILLYDYVTPAETPLLPLTPAALNHSLSGVTWLSSASMAVSRGDDYLVSYSWMSGAGQEWLFGRDEHVGWAFAPGSVSPLAPGANSAAPAWTINRDGFTTMGTLQLDSGAPPEAGVYSLPGGLVVLFEHAPANSEDALIALSKSASTEEPDLFRDDEGGVPEPGAARWVNLDNDLGMILAEGMPKSVALPGISSKDPRRSVWPLVSVSPGSENAAMVVLYPNLSAAQTRVVARDSSPLRFAGAGWSGVLMPAPGGGQQLVVGRFSGSPTTVVALSSHLGAPVAVEDGVISGSMSTLALSSPDNAARWESISCWLNAGIRGAVDARQAGEPGAATITNPGQDEVLITARYLSTGRSCTLTAEDGRVIFRLPARRSLGEVHFSLASGRTVMFRY